MHVTTSLHSRRLGFLLALALLAVSHPAAAAPRVTAPRDYFGFRMGEDYCLANYQQFAGYWAKLERESDRHRQHRPDRERDAVERVDGAVAERPLVPERCPLAQRPGDGPRTGPSA